MLVGLDSETHLITRAEPVPRLVVAQTYDETAGAQLWHRDDPRTLPMLQHLFEWHHVTLANAAFDVFAFLRQWPQLWPVIRYAYESDRVHDVLIREKLLAIAIGQRKVWQPFNLKTVAARRIGVELDKDGDTRKGYGDLDALPCSAWPANAIEYALRDPWATYHTHVAQDAARFSPHGDVLANEGHQVRTALALYAQSIYGIDTDPDNARALLAKLDREIAELEWWAQQAGLAREGGTARTPRVVKTRKAAEAAVAEFAAAMGHTAKTTKKGAIAVSKTALADLQLPPTQYAPDGRIAWIHPLDAYRRLGGLQALRTKWFPLLLHPRVWTHYHNPVDSGRSGSSGSRLDAFADVSENLQNIPRETTYAGFRKCFRARSGKLLAVSDWSGVELGTQAQNSLDWFGHSAFADMLARGEDIHANVGMLLLDQDPRSYDPKNPTHKNARQDAKPVTFGKMGLLGARRLVTFARDNYGRHLTLEQAEAYGRKWYASLPDMRQYHDRIKSEVPFGSTCTVIQPWSGRVRGECMATDAANTRFQGRAGDLAGIALWWLLCESLDPTSILAGVRQVMFTHDENVSELDDPGDHREVAKGQPACACRACAQLARQDEIMVRAFNMVCPDVRIRVESGVHTHYEK